MASKPLSEFANRASVTSRLSPSPLMPWRVIANALAKWLPQFPPREVCAKSPFFRLKTLHSSRFSFANRKSPRPSRRISPHLKAITLPCPPPVTSRHRLPAVSRSQIFARRRNISFPYVPNGLATFASLANLAHRSLRLLIFCWARPSCCSRQAPSLPPRSFEISVYLWLTHRCDTLCGFWHFFYSFPEAYGLRLLARRSTNQRAFI